MVLDDQSDADETRSNVDIDRASVKSLEETQQSWLLGAGGEDKKKKGIDLGCVVISRRMCCLGLAFFIFCGFIAGLVCLIIFTLPHHHKHVPIPDNYTQALHLALQFFDAQWSGVVPKNYNIKWRGNSALRDGLETVVNGPKKDLTGGFYDAGDNIKFVFPGAYAMTILSWGVIEYKQKYIAANEYDHARTIIRWGTDFLFKTFNYTVNTTNIPYIYAQVGSGSAPSKTDNDHYCWERPETMDYARTAYAVSAGSDLAGEMAATMAAASIVFRDDPAYSKKCLIASQSLLNFAQDPGKRSRYTAQVGDPDSVNFYNSTSYWDEFLWANAWLYFASGNVSYLTRATTLGVAVHANAQGVNTKYYGVLSWDNKLLGAQLLMTKLRMLKSPPYPYENLLFQYNNETNLVMCSYLPMYKQFNQSRGGLTLFNYGNPSPLQYSATSAFVASLFADYLTSADIPVWPCGPEFYPADKLKEFARSQIDYILGKNPLGMSYVVGFGRKYPLQVHHRAASTPYNGVRYSCTGGFQFRDSPAANVHVINGAMVGGPNKYDQFLDKRVNFTFTEPTVAGNAGLIGALISLSDVVTPSVVDTQTMFADIPSFYVEPPPPPAPWRP